MYCQSRSYRFTKNTFDLRLKRVNLARQSDIANFLNKTDFNNKLEDVTSNNMN